MAEFRMAKVPASRAFFGQKAAASPKKKSRLEEDIANYIGRNALPQPIREFRFLPPRQFKFDFAWPALGIALEVEGGIFTHGRHSRGLSFAVDCDKYNLAAERGWRVFRVTLLQLRDRSAYALLDRILRTPITYSPDVLVPVDDAPAAPAHEVTQR